MAYCDVCQGNKTINLVCYPDEQPLGVSGANSFDSITMSSKRFPCPQCQMVPYKRVRAMKVVSEYQAEEFGRLQVPIERSLAARFGEYLMREGLIKFTTSGSEDLGRMEKKITVTAHLGVVSREDVKRAEAVEEVAFAPQDRSIPDKIARRLQRKFPKATVWQPPGAYAIDDPITDEFDEPKDALGARFSGLEI